VSEFVYCIPALKSVLVKILAETRLCQDGLLVNPFKLWFKPLCQKLAIPGTCPVILTACMYDGSCGLCYIV